MDVQRLQSLLARASNSLETLEFLEPGVTSLLEDIGLLWESGEISVAHEHLASDAVQTHLRTLIRQPASKGTRTKRTAMAATLEKDGHTLAIPMLSLVCQAAGIQCTILGANSPVENIRAVAERLACTDVLIHVSSTRGGLDADRQLKALQQALPKGANLIIGGAGARGARRGVPNARYISTLTQLYEELQQPGAPRNRCRPA